MRGPVRRTWCKNQAMRAPDIDSAALHDAMRDDQLMLAYASGDTAAFDVLYGRHEGAMYRFVRRLMGARRLSEVDGVFQETWERIVTARESFAPQGAQWRTWAFTIAHNLAVDRMRADGGELVPPVRHGAGIDVGDTGDAMPMPGRSALGDDAQDEADIAHGSAEDAAFWRAAATRMLECLDELPLEERSAFLLHHEDGFGAEAMAAALDVKLETVRSRVHHALARLRTCMDPQLTVLRTRE